MDLVSNEVRTLDLNKKFRDCSITFKDTAIFEVLHSVQKLILCLF